MKALFFLAVISLAAFASASASFEFTALWNAWKNVNNKVYETVEEDLERFEIFVENYFRVVEWNAAADEDGARLALNKFADMTKEEFKAKMTGGARVETDQEFIRQNTVEPEYFGVLPLSVDWVKKGAVTPVKNQQQCGSCWTFSTTGVLEGFNFLQSGTLLSFSEQQIVDCDTNDGNQGCDGGWPYLAIQYAAENGLELESDYPYAAVDQSCSFDSSKAHQLSGAYAFVTVNSSVALKTAIVLAPVSVLIEADQDVFQMYSSGVIKSGCGATIDHAVLAVGYGIVGVTEAFTVKNSWDVTWGDQGYVYLATDEKQNGGQGVCGIYYQPVSVAAA